jgi:4-nitrophenyl phosphatase
MSDKLPANISAIILDMDGVLWRGDSPIGDLHNIFNFIDAKGLKYTLATNNATKTPEQYQQKLASFGASVETSHIITSSQAVAALLMTKFPNGGPVFIIGEDGLEKALQDCGFFPSENDALAVIAGLDRKLSYSKLQKAALLIRAGVPFYGTNPDKTFPTPTGLVPGAGAILALLETSTNIHPIIAGKPFPFMFGLALSRMNVTANSTVSIGDRLETDILGGKNAGCRTALVLSGVTNIKELSISDIKPDFIANSLTDFLQ